MCSLMPKFRQQPVITGHHNYSMMTVMPNHLLSVWHILSALWRSSALKLCLSQASFMTVPRCYSSERWHNQRWPTVHATETFRTVMEFLILITSGKTFAGATSKQKKRGKWKGLSIRGKCYAAYCLCKDLQVYIWNTSILYLLDFFFF